MKMSIKLIIFAVALVSLTATTNNSFANDHDSVSSNVILVKGAENKFADFMNQKAKRFVKKENWNIFEQIVTLYNVSPSKFLLIDADQKVAFNEAVKNLDKKLGKMHSDEAATWRTKVQATAKVINFLWDNKFNVEPAPTEQMESSAVAMTEMLGQ